MGNPWDNAIKDSEADNTIIGKVDNTEENGGRKVLAKSTK